MGEFLTPQNQPVEKPKKELSEEEKKFLKDRAQRHEAEDTMAFQIATHKGEDLFEDEHRFRERAKEEIDSIDEANYPN